MSQAIELAAIILSVATTMNLTDPDAPLLRAKDAVKALQGLWALGNASRLQRYVDWLGSASEERQLSAQQALESVCADSRRAKLLRHSLREILFGSESISLAAMAVLASEAALPQQDAAAAERLARSVDGLADADAIVLLGMLSDLPPPTQQWRWRRPYVFGVVLLSQPQWASRRTLFSIDPDVAFGAVAELVNRRLLLPDETVARAGAGDEGTLVTHLPQAYPEVYRVLHAAVRLACPEALSELALRSPEEVARDAQFVPAAT